ncbi:hypothetical protein B0H15DRAFT_793305, partial [Mycena belliarum]
QVELSLFRVSSGILAARSPFSETCSPIPQPPESERQMLRAYGIPLNTHLRLVFDSSFFERSPSKTDLGTVISILHLSSKHVVDFLHPRALLHLSSRLPTTLCEYDADNIIVLNLSSSIAAINIAREIDALRILPPAF